MTTKDECLELLSLIEGIDTVMEEDGFTVITKDQIRQMGQLANGHIARGKNTVSNLIDIAEQFKMNDNIITRDQIQFIGGFLLKYMKEFE